jgi:N-acyl-D-amino-acid deacylase
MIAAAENPTLKQYEGRFIPAITRDEDKDEFDVLFDVLSDDRARTTMILFLMSDEDVDLAIHHDSAVIGSDQLGVTSREARVHPRSYGTFARVIQQAAVTGENAVADVISRSTGRTARRLGLEDRGFIKPGFVADLVLFQPSEVEARATYEDPTKVASGIDSVFIGGGLAFQNGEAADAGLGRVLRRR